MIFKRYKTLWIGGFIAFIFGILLLTDPPWWAKNIELLNVRNYSANYFFDSNDPSRIIDESIFATVQEINSMTTDLDKEEYLKDYIGMSTQQEIATIANITPNEYNIEVDVYNRKWDPDIFWHINCIFDNSYKQKLKVIKNMEIYFSGIVDRYDNVKKLIILRDCRLLR